MFSPAIYIPPSVLYVDVFRLKSLIFFGSKSYQKQEFKNRQLFNISTIFSHSAGSGFNSRTSALWEIPYEVNQLRNQAGL